MALKLPGKGNAGKAPVKAPAGKAKPKVLAATSGSSLALLQRFQKDFGEGVGNVGGSLIETDRIPTGLLPFDLASGGGFPRGKVSMVYGPESSGKTNLILLAIANHQRMWPDEQCVFVDAEHALDPKWATAMGVQMTPTPTCKGLIVLKPSTAEQTVNMVEGILGTSDCGLVALDSLAALVTTQEIESDAEKANVGGAGLVVGKLVRKTTLALLEAEKQGRFPTLIYINQIRHKIGVMYGNPETTPGGNAPNFQIAMKVRVYGKNVMDKKISKVMPVLKETTFAIQKWKCPIVAVSGMFKMVTTAHKGLNIGQCDDFNTVSAYLESFGEWEKAEKNKGWLIKGEVYPTQLEFKEKLYGDPAFGQTIRAGIIDKVLLEGNLLLEGDDSDE